MTDEDADDIRDVELSKCHNLSGPIGVEGAEPGDCLVLDILDTECLTCLWNPATSHLKPAGKLVRIPRNKKIYSM